MKVVYIIVIYLMYESNKIFLLMKLFPTYNTYMIYVYFKFIFIDNYILVFVFCLRNCYFNPEFDNQYYSISANIKTIYIYIYMYVFAVFRNGINS